jgi:hypothetical protein
MLFDGMAMRTGSAEAVDMSPKASAITPTKTFSILINSSSRSVIDNTDVYMRKAALGSLFVARAFAILIRAGNTSTMTFRTPAWYLALSCTSYRAL